MAYWRNNNIQMEERGMRYKIAVLVSMPRERRHFDKIKGIVLHRMLRSQGEIRGMDHGSGDPDKRCDEDARYAAIEEEKRDLKRRFGTKAPACRHG
jgi:hypothetical protein